MAGRIRSPRRTRRAVLRARLPRHGSARRRLRARGGTRVRQHERSARRGAARVSAKRRPKPDAFDPAAAPLDGVSLIEANAGTGKTWTITALYVRLLLERALAVDAILVVTFTEAATGELRDRIRNR